MSWEDMVGKKDEEVVTFEFPIRDLGGMVQIQYVPPSIFPNFHGLENEDPDEFCFNWKYSVEHLKFKI